MKNRCDSTADRPARGATFLDQVQPGWADETDPNMLTILGTRSCPLGLNCGTYKEGVRVLFPESPFDRERQREQVIAHGFLTASSHVLRLLVAKLALPDAAWVHEITTRQQKRTNSDGVL
jgi:hypothetical protein